MQESAHGSHRRLDAVFSRSNATQIRKSGDQADGAVAAHSQIAHIIEKDYARCARGIDRLAKQRPHDDVRTARLIHHGGTEIIVFGPKTFKPF